MPESEQSHRMTLYLAGKQQAYEQSKAMEAERFGRELEQAVKSEARVH